jgi:purine-binding chemotaxis protein CheW
MVVIDESAIAAAPLVVAFRIGRQRYALPLDTVLQVVRLPDLISIAGAPPLMAGLLNLRGRFLPVLDGRALMGEAREHTLESCILVLAAASGEPALGLLVDEVDAVRRFPAGSFAPIERSADFVLGMLRDSEESAIVLDAVAMHGHVSGGR